MRTFVVSAPGKCILFGEHAVVYGKPAIAVSLNLRTNVSVKCSDDVDSVPAGKLTLELDNYNTICSIDQNTILDELQGISNCDLTPSRVRSIAERLAKTHTVNPSSEKSLVALLYLYIVICHGHMRNGSISVLVQSDLILEAGLGSSAAYCVSLAAAMYTLRHGLNQSRFSTEQLNAISNYAFEGEKIFHGNPSGIDNTMCTFGGSLLYKQKKCDMLTTSKLRVLLVNSKIPRNSKAMVEKAAFRCNKFPETTVNIVDAIESVVLEVQRLLTGEELTTKSISRLQELVDMNHGLLLALGVGFAELDQIHFILARHELPSKLTGAGGGGCAIAILNPDMDGEKLKQIQVELCSAGFESQLLETGGEGVRIESSD